MPAYTTADIRNIVLVGHAGAGKTTLLEHLLNKAGATTRIGTVEDGSTTSDHETEEKHHQHSLSSSLVHIDHEGKRINIIDTPGYPDFVGQAITVLPAVETVAIVIDAHKGVQPMTRRMKQLADDRKLPSIIIINKINIPEIDLETLVADIQESLGEDCVPINLPADNAAKVIDVYENEEGDTDFSSAAEAHTALVDRVVEVDDELTEKYLGGEKPSEKELHNAFEQSLREGHLTPILFCSAKNDVGTEEILHFFSYLSPSPLEGNPRPFELTTTDGEEHKWIPEPDPAKPAVAHVFKLTTDPFVGKLVFFRVHQGTITHNSQVQRNDEKKAIRVGHVFSVQGKEHVDIDEVIAGDIGAVAKLDDLRLNDVLHDSHDFDSLHLIPPAVPRPMYGLGIHPKSRNDEAKVGGATHKLMDEDPTFIVERVVATNQTVARGMGELHMRVLIEKLKNRFGVEIETEPQRVAYRETISSKAEGHHRHKKQSGGAGQFGEVFLRVEPLPNDHENGFEFVDETFGGSVPKQFMPAIEKGVRQGMLEGAIAGYPITGVRVSVYDGKHHPVDSKEIAFMSAGKKAFVEGIKNARPVLLEPFVEIEVHAPSSYLGDLTADISGKRGRIQGTDMLPGDQCVVKAALPLVETLTYASQLKSMTQGQGSYTMDFSHEEPMPSNIQADIVALYKPKEEED